MAEKDGDLRRSIDSLTGLRGVAAIVVFLAHFEIYKSVPFLDHFKGFITWHNAAVDIFFVLSGFTLAYVYCGHDFDFKKYLVARFARIYPLYLLCLAFSIYLVHRLHLSTYSTEDFGLDSLRQLFLVSCWAPIGNGTCFNPPSWSISVETFCYIFIFPPLMQLYHTGKRFYHRYATPVMLVLLMVTSYFTFIKYYNADLVQCVKTKNVEPFSYYVNLIRGVIGFSVGYVTHYSFLKRDIFSSFCSKYADPIFGAGLLLMLGHQLDIGISNHMLVIISPLLCLACANGEGYINKLLSTRLFRHFGDLSYSIYLIHYLVILFAILRFRSYSRSPLLVVVVYLISAASYYRFEKPARNAINKWYKSVLARSQETESDAVPQTTN